MLYRYGEADNCLVENGQTNLMDLEERTFAILRYLMKQQGLRKLMLIERDYITDLCLRLDRLILKLNQKVWKLIQDSGFTCEMIFASPLISALNTSEISFGLQKRVMDLIMVQGFNIVHKIIAHFVAQT